MSFVRREEETEFGLFELFLKNVKEKRRTIYISTVVGVLAALVVLLIIPNKYLAEVKIMPDKTGGANQLASIASSVLPQSILSSSILEESGSEGDNLNGLAHSNRVLDSVLTHEYRFGENNKIQNLIALWDCDNIELARRALLTRVGIGQNDKSGIISIGVETIDPTLSAQIANQFAHELDNFKQEIDHNKAVISGEYLSRQVEENEKVFAVHEKEKAEFLSRNRNYLSSSDPQLNIEVERLNRETTFFTAKLMRLRQLEATAQMEAERDTPRLTVIESAQPPLIKSGPPRTKYFILCLLAAIMLPVGLILLRTSYRWYFPLTTRDALTDSFAIVGGDVNRVFNRVKKPFKSSEKVGV